MLYTILWPAQEYSCITINLICDISNHYFSALNSLQPIIPYSINLSTQQSCIKLERGRVGTLHTNIVKAARGVLHGTKFYD